MQHFLWGKLVLVLVAIVAILQVIHLVLLSRLEARHHHYVHRTVVVPDESSDSHVLEVSILIMQFINN